MKFFKEIITQYWPEKDDWVKSARTENMARTFEKETRVQKFDKMAEIKEFSKVYERIESIVFWPKNSSNRRLQVLIIPDRTIWIKSTKVWPEHLRKSERSPGGWQTIACHSWLDLK